MFGSNKLGAHAYAAVGLETGVQAATPHRLIVMLYDGALAAIVQAGQRMSAGDVAGKGAAINKAVAIVESGLRGGLNHAAAPETAGNLDLLYGYVVQRLMHANLRNDAVALDEACNLLRTLADAWAAIDPATTTQAAA